MTSDLEKEARAAADEIGRQVPWGNFPYMSRQHYINGYLAAAEPREKEIEALLAKLEAVPVKEIQRASWWHGAGGRIKDALAIDRWLAGLK